MHLEQAIAALRFDPLVSVWLLLALGVLALLALGPAVWRRARGVVWRIAGFAVILLWLSGPRVVQETRETLPDVGLLVVDQTAPMQLGDRTRLAQAAAASIQAQAAKLHDLELRTITVPERGDAGDRLFSAVDQALADIPRSRFAGTIAITDGQIHDIPDTPPGGAPLNVLIPAKGEETDRRLRVIEAPGYGIVGHSVTLRAVIEDLGVTHSLLSGPGSARLTIRRDGEPPKVESVPVGREQRIEVPITRAGPTVVELSAEALPGEVSALNNRAVVEINGVRDRLRVLLISGEPHPGERTWRRLLKADPSVDLVHFTILRPPEKDDLTPLNELALIAFPVRELFLEKLDEFDLIILDRFQNRGLLPLPYIANIARHVRDGGALLLSVGPEFSGTTSLAATPLGSVLPAAPAGRDAVVDEPFRPMVTALGARHPVTEDLPGANVPEQPVVPGHAATDQPAPGQTATGQTTAGQTPTGQTAAGQPAAGKPGGEPTWGSWYRRIDPIDVRGEVLMRAPDGAPLLIADRVGRGRSALLLSDQIWLWSRGHQGGGPQAELLRRIAHWLMQEPDLEENALTAKVAGGRLTIGRRSIDPAPPAEAVVTDPDGKTRTVKLAETAPGRAAASVAASTPGVWQIASGGMTAYAAAGTANPLELSDLRATATLVNKLVRASGGGVHWLDTGKPGAAPDVPELRRTEPDNVASGSSWIGLERRHDHIVTGITALALLPAWIALPLMLGLLVLGWRREGS
ncbi:MAG TPA: hypothetical protein VFE41_08325 [Acetobacteraceae bacterium]|jgi:hypothetical protein|nr:hypothetical protein [Acetobacteraceae bacterium]